MKHAAHHEVAGQETRDSVSRLLTRVSHGELSRREFVVRATVLGVSLSSVGALLAACGKEAAGSAAPAMSQDLPEQLLVYNWEEYMAPEVLKSFEKKTGIKCVETYFDSNEALSKTLAQGAAYDVIFPGDSWVTSLSKDGLIQPLDMSLLPNFEHVLQPTFIKPSYDNEADGHKYSVPYMFGTTGFCANLTQVPNPKESWSQLWDEKYKQQISMIGAPGDSIGAALILLGYSPYSTDQAEIDAATRKLIEQKPLVGKYEPSTPSKEIRDGFALVHCWDGDVIFALQNGMAQSDLRYVLPSEGYMVWADGVCIPTSSPSPYAAHLFLNHMMEPRNMGACANYTGYQPVIDEAMLYVKNPVQQHMRPSAETIANGLIAADRGSSKEAFDAAWQKVMDA